MRRTHAITQRAVAQPALTGGTWSMHITGRILPPPAVRTSGRRVRPSSIALQVSFHSDSSPAPPQHKRRATKLASGVMGGHGQARDLRGVLPMLGRPPRYHLT